MQISNKKLLTKAVVASSLLLCGTGAFAAPLAITTVNNNVATINVSNGAGGLVNETVTFSASGAVLTVGAPAFTVAATTANAVAPATFNIAATTQPIEITSNFSAILFNGGAGNFTQTGAGAVTINTSASVVVETTGAVPTIDLSPTNAAANADVIINNSGIIRNTSTSSAIRTSAQTLLTINNNAGGSILGGVGATAIDLTATRAASTINNSGTINSNGGTAILGVGFATNITQTAGLITGKTNVINTAVAGSTTVLNGGSVVATDGATGVAITTAGTVTIGGNNVGVTGIIRSTNAAAGSININPGANNSFTTNGVLDPTGAGGNVVVTSGTLNLRNSISNSAAGAGAGGLNVLAAGAVNVNANQTVAGAITMAAGSKGSFDLTNSAVAPVFGQLLTTVASNVAGANLTVTNLGNGYIANNTAYKIIDTTVGGLATAGTVVNVPNALGTAVNTGSTGVYTYTAALNANDVTVNVVRRGLNTFGNRDTAGLINGVGNALESIGQASNLAGAVNNADMMRLLGELGRLPDAGSVADALRQLVPPTNQMTMQAAVDSSKMAYNAVENRMNLARAGVDDAEGYAAGDSASGSAVWGQVFGNHADQKRRKGIFGYKSDTAGLALGTDMMVSEDVRLGGALSYASNKSKTKSNPRNQNDMKSYQFTVYGAYEVGCGFWDGMVSYANLRHKGIRRMQFGAINNVATNNHRGSEWAARVGYGHQYKSDNGWDVIPSASLGWNHITERTYTERGAAGFNLRVNSHSVDFVALGADVKFAYPMEMESGKFVPDFHVGVDYDVVSKREELNATFVAAGPTFRVRGLEPARFGVDAGVGLTLMTKNDISFGVNYDANMKKDYFSHAGFLTVRYAL